ncbi:MAG TPA: addiction module antidote protein, HigA family [Rhodospirillales bacterium]|nr:addiction module antidote protein, HigA family [Rhodospirillales bacterium]
MDIIKNPNGNVLPAQAPLVIVEAKAKTVANWLAAGTAVLIDVRETSEYEQEHIPGSMLVPLSVLDADKFPRITGKKLVIHCAVGKRSAAAVRQLIKAGYTPPAINLEGGLRAWKAAGLETEIQDVPYISPAVAARAVEAHPSNTPAAHPGRVLMEEYMKPLGLSQSRVAREIGIPPRRLAEVIHAKRAITTDLAFRLARYFSTCEEFWLRLQMAFDLDRTRLYAGEKIRREITPLKAA